MTIYPKSPSIVGNLPLCELYYRMNGITPLDTKFAKLTPPVGVLSDVATKRRRSTVSNH